MAQLPASGYFSNSARTKGEQKTALEDQRDAIAQLVGGAAESALTIAAGVVTATLGVHAVDTESAAATDDLTNVLQTTLPDGSVLLVHSVSAARVVTAKHAAGGAGQLSLRGAADRRLDDPSQWLMLKRTGTLWEEITIGELAWALLTTKGDLLIRGATGPVRFAAPTNGQYLQADSSTASGWKGAALSVVGGYATRGLLGTVTTTTITVTADYVQLRDPTTGAIVVHQPAASLVLDAATSGLNGRDQVAAFSASQDLHAYYISNGTTLKLVLSDAAPIVAGAVAGPDLTTIAGFAGYTYWAYLGAFYWNGSSNFIPARIRGGYVTYNAYQNVLSGGAATTETSITISAVVPTAALRVILQTRGNISKSSAVASLEATFELRTVTGNSQIRHELKASGTSDGNKKCDGQQGYVEVPNTGALYYLWTSVAGTPTLSAELDVVGYVVANGGE